MKPVFVLLLGAAVARVLWWLPAWVTVVLLSGLVVAVAAEELRRRWRLKHPIAVSGEPRPVPFDEWEECAAEFRNPDASMNHHGGSFFRCVERKGHAGAHLADRSSVYWSS